MKPLFSKIAQHSIKVSENSVLLNEKQPVGPDGPPGKIFVNENFSRSQWRGGHTRSHSEHGSQAPQRRWYCPLAGVGE